MPDKIEEAYSEWFNKAGEDELSIYAIIHEGGAPSTACFLSQQMAEKYLKALLVFRKKTFPKVHDLLNLATRLMESDTDIETIQEDLVLLNRYYIETRYPGDYPSFSLEEGKGAFESALRIKNFVWKKIEG